MKSPQDPLPMTMRRTLAALALLLAPTLLGGAALAQEEPAAGRHLLLVATNEDTVPRRIYVEVLEGETDRRVAAWEETIPPGTTVHHPVAVEAGRFRVRSALSGTSAEDGVSRDGPVRAFFGASADTTDCPGGTWIAIPVPKGAGVAAGAGPLGCDVIPPSADLFRAEVARHLASAPSAEGFAVAAPRDGDRGRYFVWQALSPPDWPNATDLDFEWRNGVNGTDAWGRAMTGPEVRHALNATGFSLAQGFLSSLGGGPATTNGTHFVSFARYGPGATSPYLRTLTTRTEAGTNFIDADALLTDYRRYDLPPDGRLCLFRYLAQGTVLQPGSRIPAAEFCAVPGLAAAAPGAEWVVGAPGEHLGHRAIPLVLSYDGDEFHADARAWIAEGIPYPLEVEAYTLSRPCCADHSAYRLTHLEAAGAPIISGPPPTEPPHPELAPLDPLRGPVLADERAAFAVPLDVAAATATERSPHLARLQVLLLAGDAVLAGARYRVEARASAAEPETHRWALRFTAPGAEPVHVVCASRLPAPPMCEEVDTLPDWASGLGDGPVLGEGDLPATAASFDLAVSRWRIVPDAPEAEQVTSATYRAWDVASDLACPTACIAVGQEPPIAGAAPRTTATTGSHLLAVDLREGRLLSERAVVQRVAGLGPLPVLAAPPGAAPAPSEGLLGGAPALVAVSVAAATALALLLIAAGALYTRLQRAAVLDLDTRAEVYGLVKGDPGIHALALAERLGRPRRVTDYHLDVLVREGYLTCIETPGFKRYFVRGSLTPEEMRRLAALRHPAALAAYEAIRVDPGISLSALAERANLSLPHASKTVKKLVASGLVERAQQGRTVTLRLKESESAR